MRAARSLVAVMVFAGFALSCADPTAPTDSLTERQAVAMFRTVWDVSRFAGISERQCPVGGSAAGHRAWDRWERGDTIVTTLAMVATLVDCGVRAGADTLTTNGDPGMTIAQVSQRVSNREPKVTISITGAVKWRFQDGERSDICVIDLTAESSTWDFDFTGRLCGIEGMVIHLSELAP